MAFLIQLISVWCLLWLLSYIKVFTLLKSHTAKGRIAFASGFIIVGSLHIFKPQEFVYMIRSFIPEAELVIVVTGVIEIFLAILLLSQNYRKAAAWLTIIYLVVVFPANVFVAIKHLPPPGGLPSSPWYTWSRLAFQPLYIIWIYLSAIQTEKKRVAESPRKPLNANRKFS